MDEYLIIDTGVTSSGDTISKIRGFDENGKIFIKQYSGVNNSYSFIQINISLLF
jgi:MinD-like ATPase involved in chromosome partitioning or flagellar assembly